MYVHDLCVIMGQRGMTSNVWRILYGVSSFFPPLFEFQGLKSGPQMYEASKHTYLSHLTGS